MDNPSGLSRDNQRACFRQKTRESSVGMGRTYRTDAPVRSADFTIFRQCASTRLASRTKPLADLDGTGVMCGRSWIGENLEAKEHW